MKPQLDEIECMDLVHRIVRNSIWDFKDVFPNIVMDQQSMAPIALIVGTIHGIWQRNEKLALFMAKEFFGCLKFLSVCDRIPVYHPDSGSNMKTESKIILLAQSGFMSLGFSQWRFRRHDELEDLQKNIGETRAEEVRLIDEHGNRGSLNHLLGHRQYYTYDGNGGINFASYAYKGTPKDGFKIENRLKSENFWSVNT